MSESRGDEDAASGLEGHGDDGPHPEAEGPADRAVGDASDQAVPERFVPLAFTSVEMELPSTHPLLVLREIDGSRELRIPIGVAEGVAIAYVARGIATPRPLTHELFVTALSGLGATIETLRITGVERSAYRAELVVSAATGTLRLACRVSDGVCLALHHRPPVPLTATEAVLEEVAFDVGES